MTSLHNYGDLEIAPPINQIEKHRLFVPLISKWFDLFKSGEKQWELRGISTYFNQKSVKVGKPVELRRGYSKESLYGMIVERIIVTDMSSIPSDIWDKTIPEHVRDEPETDKFLEYYREKYSKFILFKIILNGGLDEDEGVSRQARHNKR